MRSTFDSIIELTDKFCREYLNDEYAQILRELTAALCRKRPSPLLRGRANVWACGIIYALGYVNFLFDRTQRPYVSADQLCNTFCVTKSTGYNKSKIIRDIFKMIQLDPNWCLPSLTDKNPLVWMIEVNGLAVDARFLPRGIQEIAFQKGLIPYIPEEKRSREIDSIEVENEGTLDDGEEKLSRERKRKRKSRS